MNTKKLKVNDRVKRINASGCYGTIKDIRQEVSQSTISSENKDRALMVSVLWDNGTLSTFGIDSLEQVKE